MSMDIVAAQIEHEKSNLTKARIQWRVARDMNDLGYDYADMLRKSEEEIANSQLAIMKLESMVQANGIHTGH